MKLTKKDIKKYTTKEEKAFLKENLNYSPLEEIKKWIAEQGFQDESSIGRYVVDANDLNDLIDKLLDQEAETPKNPFGRANW